MITSPDALDKIMQLKPETFKSINYTALIPVLIAALQEQQKEIEALKKMVR